MALAIRGRPYIHTLCIWVYPGKDDVLLHDLLTGENPSEKILQQRLFKKDNVEIIWDSVLEEVTGEKSMPPSVTGANIKNIKTGEITQMPIDGVFIAIGHAPQTALFEGKLKKKPSFDVSHWM